MTPDTAPLQNYAAGEEYLKEPKITTPEQAQSQAEKFSQEGYSELFILVRMAELGFIPRTNFETLK